MSNMQIVEAACRRDFLSFARKCFHTLAPNSPFQMNRYIQAIAHHLELVRRGIIKRLIINAPPRSLKSLLTSVAFPAYGLGLEPWKKYLVISYNSELAIKPSNEFRMIVHAPWHQELFPAMRILKDSESEVYTTQNGCRLAKSIDGTVTGLGADIIIIDDPLKAIDAYSDHARNRVNAAFFESVLSRLDDPQYGAVIIVMQRLHIDDLTGAVLRSGPDWTVLSFPAIAEQEEQIQIGNNRYYFRRVGDVLQPERMSREFLDSRRAEIGTERFAAHYQQNPLPSTGVIVNPQWIQRYEELPNKTSTAVCLQSWDTAVKPGEGNSRSACVTVLKQDNNYYVMDLLVGQFDYLNLVENAVSQARAHNPNKILIEDVGLGTALIQDLKKRGLPVVPVIPERDKLNRLVLQVSKFTDDQVFLPRRRQWLPDLESELFLFPHGRYDDVVDALVQALGYQHTAYGWTPKALDNLDKVMWSGWAFR